HRHGRDPLAGGGPRAFPAAEGGPGHVGPAAAQAGRAAGRVPGAAAPGAPVPEGVRRGREARLRPAQEQARLHQDRQAQRRHRGVNGRDPGPHRRRLLPRGGRGPRLRELRHRRPGDPRQPQGALRQGRAQLGRGGQGHPRAGHAGQGRAQGRVADHGGPRGRRPGRLRRRRDLRIREAVQGRQLQVRRGPEVGGERARRVPAQAAAGPRADRGQPKIVGAAREARRGRDGPEEIRDAREVRARRRGPRRPRLPPALPVRALRRLPHRGQEAQEAHDRRAREEGRQRPAPGRENGRGLRGDHLRVRARRRRLPPRARLGGQAGDAGRGRRLRLRRAPRPLRRPRLQGQGRARQFRRREVPAARQGQIRHDGQEAQGEPEQPGPAARHRRGLRRQRPGDRRRRRRRRRRPGEREPAGRAEAGTRLRDRRGPGARAVAGADAPRRLGGDEQQVHGREPGRVVQAAEPAVDGRPRGARGLRQLPRHRLHRPREPLLPDGPGLRLRHGAARGTARDGDGRRDGREHARHGRRRERAPRRRAGHGDERLLRAEDELLDDVAVAAFAVAAVEPRLRRARRLPGEAREPRAPDPRAARVLPRRRGLRFAHVFSAPRPPRRERHGRRRLRRRRGEPDAELVEAAGPDPGGARARRRRRRRRAAAGQEARRRPRGDGVRRPRGGRRARGGGRRRLREQGPPRRRPTLRHALPGDLDGRAVGGGALDRARLRHGEDLRHPRVGLPRRLRVAGLPRGAQEDRRGRRRRARPGEVPRLRRVDAEAPEDHPRRRRRVGLRVPARLRADDLLRRVGRRHRRGRGAGARAHGPRVRGDGSALPRVRGVGPRDRRNRAHGGVRRAPRLHGGVAVAHPPPRRPREPRGGAAGHAGRAAHPAPLQRPRRRGARVRLLRHPRRRGRHVHLGRAPHADPALRRRAPARRGDLLHGLRAI
ncbi:hypothetical protein AURANDRAFT_70981, partial [Aureococcus anophagefferens]